MALFDKLSSIAKNVGDKAGDAIETGKLNLKINSEKNAAGEDFKKIGEFYYSKFIETGAADAEVAELLESAKAHFDAAAAAQAEIDGIKAENQAEKAAAAEEPAPAPAAPAGRFCPNCGAALADGVKFCGACGSKLGD